MTPLQTAMLNKIACSDHNAVSGAAPKKIEDVGEIWANVVIGDAEDKGVFTTLLTAGSSAMKRALSRGGRRIARGAALTSG